MSFALAINAYIISLLRQNLFSTITSDKKGRQQEKGHAILLWRCTAWPFYFV